MSGKHKFTKAYKGLDVQKADEVNPIPGILGFLINGVQTVEVPNRNGYVYVRLRDNLSEVCQAYNDNVSPVYGLPVLMIRDSTNRTRYKILGRDLGRYQDWGTSSPYLPRHGTQHSFNPPTEGGDITWIYSRQLMPLSVYPSGTIGAGNVLIYPYTFYRNNVWHYAGGTGTANLLSYKPTGSNNAKMVLVYLDDADAPAYVAGNEFSATLTGTTQIYQYIPSLPITSGLPLAGIRLVTGTSVILWDNLYDLRPWLVGDGFIPTGSYGHLISDEGSNLPIRPILNFVGNNLWAIDDVSNSRTNIIISGTNAPATYPAIYDDSVFKGTGTSLNFTTNLVVTVTGTAMFISSSGDGGGASTYPAIYDNGVFESTGTSISFNENLSVAHTGTSVFVSASGGTGTFLPNMQVGYGNDVAIIGDSRFLFDDANQTLSIGGSNLSNLHGGNRTLALLAAGASRPVINLDYYGSSGYPRIQFSSASGIATALGSVGSGRALMELSAYGFITGSSGARWREGFEFFVYTNNPWTITGAASARAELYIKSITGSSATGDTQIMLMTREKIDFDTSLNISGTFMTNGFIMGRGATAGYVLTSDANGIGTWQPSSGTASTGTSTVLPDKEIAFGNGAGITSSSRFTYNSATDSLTVGTITPHTGALLSIHGDDVVGNWPYFDIFGFGNGWIPTFETYNARGTSLVKEPILNTDQFFAMDFYGWATGSSNSWLRGVSLEGIANANWDTVGGNHSPSYLKLSVGSASISGLVMVGRFDASKIDFSGNLNVSGTSKSGSLQITYYTFSGSNPPTNAQLDAGIGTPTTVGKGFTAYWDNNNVGTNVYLLSSDGTNWWHQAMTKAL